MFERSSNPMFRNQVMETTYNQLNGTMTLGGTVNKLILLTLIMFLGAGVLYNQIRLEHIDYVSMLMMTGCIGGFVIAIILAFKQDWANFLAPVYAFIQGFVIMGMSFYAEAMYPGIVTQAVALTMGTVLIMALLFKAKAIRATEKFRSVIFIATSTIAVFYLISLILSFFHINIPYFTNSTSPINIAINCIIVLVASLNLIIDFEFIERGSQMHFPKYFEMYGAFGLLITILWMYIEILRLLMRLNSRR